MSDSIDRQELQNPETLYVKLIDKIVEYHPSSDISLIFKAYCIARNAHGGQARKSGEPYIIHPLSVAIILADLELDKETIAAGLLHDVVEDTGYTNEEIAEMFNEDVAYLVDGVTKLEKIPYAADKVELEAENLRKMFLAMAKDIRVIIIKLADRLHNMRTLTFQSEVKQIKIAKETLDIYAPLANRLGIAKIKNELDDLSLRYMEAEAYRDLVLNVEHMKGAKEAFINEMIEDVRERLEENGILGEVNGKQKHFFSVYRKMVRQNKTLEQMYDLFTIRIVLETVKDCYAALGIMHESYKPVPGRFKDYIAMPKTNKYQSIHTTLISPGGQPFEVQIRTREMDKVAEYGIAAHWKYKEGVVGKNQEDGEEEKLTWLREILEWQRDMPDNREFMYLVKNDLNVFSERIYCFTPKGEVKNLPNGANAIDFAYAIHSAVGNRMVGARVNGKMMPFDYAIQNGDQIEIITSQNSAGPNRNWLGLVKTPRARNRINQWFMAEFKESNITQGKEMLSAYLEAKGIAEGDVMKPEWMEQTMKKYGFKDWESLLAAIGHGGLKEGQVVNKLVSMSEEDRRESMEGKSVQDMDVRYSKCCNPVPGDEVVGFVTKGHVMAVHRTDCINVMNLSELDRGRLVELDWRMIKGYQPLNEQYLVEVTILAKNRLGILAEVSAVMVDKQIDVTALNSRTNKEGVAIINIAFEIQGKEELMSLMDRFHELEGVTEVTRTNV